MAQTVEMTLTHWVTQVAITSRVSIALNKLGLSEDELGYEEIKEDISDAIMKYIAIKKTNIPESDALIYETNFTLII